MPRIRRDRDSSRSEQGCTFEWANHGAGKQLTPWGLRLVPGISQVSENGILSAYVSLLAASK
jgi:hypothetical protein